MVTRVCAVALLSVAVVACHSRESPQSNPAAPSVTISVVLSGTVTTGAGVPVAGATVVAVATPPVQTTTDAAGHFELPPLEMFPGASVALAVQKAGYGTVTAQANPRTSRVNFEIRLAEVHPLTIDGTVFGQLLPADPGLYVGDPYESDYARSAARFEYVAPVTQDVSVDLSWPHTGNATLRMWLLKKEVTSQASGDHEVIVLPRGTEGTLIVGQDNLAGPLTQPVEFTLVVHRIGG